MVGAVRFELTTSCTRNKRASQATLRPEPKSCRLVRYYDNEDAGLFCPISREGQAHSSEYLR